MERYAEANLSAGKGLADFFQETAQIAVLNLPVVGKDEEDMFESARIYMERAGRPFNYLPTEEEVHAEILARRTEREEAEEEKAGEGSRAADDEAHEEREERRHMERLRLIAEHEEQQRQLHELPLREYIMRFIVPNLTEGLSDICKVLPDNPVDYLATYLEEHAHAAAKHSGD